MAHIPVLYPLSFLPHFHLPLCCFCLCLCVCYFYSLECSFPGWGLGSALFLLRSFPKESCLPETFSDQQCKTAALTTSPHRSISCNKVPSVTLLHLAYCITYCFLSISFIWVHVSWRQNYLSLMVTFAPSSQEWVWYIIGNHKIFVQGIKKNSNS